MGGTVIEGRNAEYVQSIEGRRVYKCDCCSSHWVLDLNNHHHQIHFQNIQDSHTQHTKPVQISLPQLAKMRSSTIIFLIASVATGAHATIVEEFFNDGW